MRSFSASGARLTEWPATRASPSVGGRIPASIRSVVVLPAPSGPTRPNRSPRGIAKLSRSTAVTGPKARVSPVSSIAGADIDPASVGPGGSCALLPRAPPPGLSSPTAPCRFVHGLSVQPDLGVRRHPRLQLLAGVIQRALDREDQLDPLLLGLDVLRRELGFGADEGDRPPVDLARVGVGAHLDRLPELDAAELGLGDVDLEPDAAEVGDRHHGRAGAEHLARLHVLAQDHAGLRAPEHGVAELGLGRRQRGAVPRDRGLGRRDLLARQPHLQLARLRQAEGGLRLLHLGCRPADLVPPRPPPPPPGAPPAWAWRPSASAPRISSARGPSWTSARRSSTPRWRSSATSSAGRAAARAWAAISSWREGRSTR